MPPFFPSLSHPLSYLLWAVRSVTSSLLLSSSDMDTYLESSIWLLGCSALRSAPITGVSSLLWPRLTSHGSLLLRVAPSVRPHGISLQSFLVYLPNLHIRVTIAFWTLRLLARSSAVCASVLGSCSSGYDFAIPSSRPSLTT